MDKFGPNAVGPNFLTFDIEDWYHANYAGVDLSVYRGRESNFRADVDWLLQCCSEAGCKATFFVLGQIGETYPDVPGRRLADFFRHYVASA